MDDRTTPHLAPESPGAITFASLSTGLSGGDFLSDRETRLQARLSELEAELSGLGDVPDDVESLEGQALDALRTLFDLLEPPTPAPVTALRSDPMAVPASLVDGGHGRKSWWMAGIAAGLFVVALLAFSLVWIYRPDRLERYSPATTMALATATSISAPSAPTGVRPTPSPATVLPAASPTLATPILPETPAWIEEIAPAERVQILDISGTVRLELPLTTMANRVQIVEGRPVLQPVLPAGGAGVQQVPFGESGRVIVAIAAEAAPAGLWQVRPGDRLTGCNDDGACYDYQVTAMDTWPLQRLQRAVTEISTRDEVLLYTVIDETSAWVVQAQPAHREETR